MHRKAEDMETDQGATAAAGRLSAARVGILALIFYSVTYFIWNNFKQRSNWSFSSCITCSNLAAFLSSFIPVICTNQLCFQGKERVGRTMDSVSGHVARMAASRAVSVCTHFKCNVQVLKPKFQIPFRWGTCHQETCHLLSFQPETATRRRSIQLNVNPGLTPEAQAEFQAMQER